MFTKTVSFSDISNGMELAEAVVNFYGQTMFPAGTIIDEKHLRSLKLWGIKEVIVKSREQVIPTEITSMLDFETSSILKKRMNWTPMNDHEVDLLSLAVQTISKNKK